MELNRPPHILSLTLSEKKKFLNSFDIILCDCDGVIWQIMQQPIENVEKGVIALKNFGKKFLYVTNNSIRSTEVYAKKFKEANVDVDLDNEVIHPVKTIVSYLKEIKFDGLIYCIATTAFKAVLQDAGFNIIDGPNRMLEENFNDLAKNIFDNQPVKAVIIDVDYNLSAAKLIRAHLYLRNPECIFIGGACDRKIPFGNSDIIGPGPYINVVENSSLRKATILGKPGIGLGNYLMKTYQIKFPNRVLFIGDSLQTDVEFGKMCGFQTLVVLTGGTKIEDLDKIKNINELPDYYADSLYDFEEFTKDLQKI